MEDSIRIPNVTFLSTSRKGESSYAASVSPSLGVAWIDQFTLRLSDQFDVMKRQQLSDGNLHMFFPPQMLNSVVTLAATSPPALVDIDGYFSQGKTDVSRLQSSRPVRYITSTHDPWMSSVDDDVWTAPSQPHIHSQSVTAAIIQLLITWSILYIFLFLFKSRRQIVYSV